MYEEIVDEMSRLHQIIEYHWQHPQPVLTCLLWPFARMFALISTKRRHDFLSGRRKAEKLAVPVVVVGNIHVGGVGKTPVVSSLVLALQQKGLKVGIISRGYGRKSQNVHVLNEQSSAEEAGDEPLLLYRQTGVPMAVASSRVEAGKALLFKHPQIDVIVADDGLQHYALARDVEIVVFPFADLGRTDLDLLPNGGLREPVTRLQEADAVVLSGCPEHYHHSSTENTFISFVRNGQIYRLNHPDEKLDLGRLKNKKVAAIAAIAKPERFFNSLKNMGIELSQTIVLPDHADISLHDFPKADFILVTEKDAVKLGDVVDLNVWVLPICAIIQPDLAEFVLAAIEH